MHRHADTLQRLHHLGERDAKETRDLREQVVNLEALLGAVRSEGYADLGGSDIIESESSEGDVREGEGDAVVRLKMEVERQKMEDERQKMEEERQNKRKRDRLAAMWGGRNLSLAFGEWVTVVEDEREGRRKAKAVLSRLCG